MRRYFETNNYWRFSWKRQDHGTVQLRSLTTGLHYYCSIIMDSYVRSNTMRRLLELARKQARTTTK
jgi:hypothetical protein